MSIGWGIVGTGGIAARMAAALRRVPDATLAAVGSRTPERAAAFAAAHDVPQAHASLAALLQDPDVDVVYVASPHSEHCRQAVQALQAGKHVLVEKPMALSAQQVKAMVGAARDSGGFLMEAVWSRFLPAYARLRELVADGSIGDVRSVESTTGFVAPFDAEHRIYRRDLGGGVLMDMGVYPLQLALMLLGAPDRVAAHAELGPTGVDHDTVVTLGFPGGRSALLHASLTQSLPGTSRIVGTHGWVELPDPVFAPESLRCSTSGQRPVVLDLPTGGDGWRYQVHEVHRCLAAGLTQSPVMSWDDSLLLATTADQVLEAIGVHYPTDC